MGKTIRVICACGSSIATSTIIASKVEDFLKSKGYNPQVKKATYTSLDSDIKSYKPDFVLTSSMIREEKDIPILLGLPYLTGLGKKELETEILEIIARDE